MDLEALRTITMRRRNYDFLSLGVMHQICLFLRVPRQNDHSNVWKRWLFNDNFITSPLIDVFRLLGDELVL